MSAVTLLVGHRGVGKTTLLRRLGTYRRSDRHFYDLDQEIELATGLKIPELFARGESAFRQLEMETLEALVKEGRQRFARNAEHTFIAVGAGIEKIPDGVHVVWVRRSTDALGRVFENRPRLDGAVSPFAEYRQRFPIREARFREWAFEELFLPEGYESGMEGFFEHKPDWTIPFDLTLKAENFRCWPDFLAKRKRWGLRRFELRDDLLSPVQISQALTDIPPEQILFAIRSGSEAPAGLAVDWPLERGAPPANAAIVSLHERSADFSAATRRLSEAAHESQICKLAVPINSFSELLEGHRWWLENPLQRAFLPRSEDGRWRWYRSLFGPTMPIHFIREGEGSGLDQPLLWQAVHQPRLQKDFAAVLGDPVEHSRSPIEHLSFFREFSIPFVAIKVGEAEWDQALPVLRHLGLAFAAVTAPLKNKAGPTGHPANTLTWTGSWQADNTDALALKELAEDFEAVDEVWCWGQGAMSASVRAAWPRARLISAREGLSEGGKPDLFIWATGRSRSFKWPLESVQPRRLLDLNYTEDSPGLEWAVVRKIPYQSGLRMFKLQAELQRGIWRNQLEKKSEKA